MTSRRGGSKRGDELKDTTPVIGKSDTEFMCDPSTDLEKFVQDIDNLLLHERIRRLPKAIRALEEVMKRDECGTLRTQVLSSLVFVVSWAKQSAGHGQPLNMYRGFARAAELYANRLPPSKEKTTIRTYEAQQILFFLSITLFD